MFKNTFKTHQQNLAFIMVQTKVQTKTYLVNEYVYEHDFSLTLNIIATQLNYV